MQAQLELRESPGRAHRRKTGQKVFSYTLLILITTTLFIPVFWLVVTSLKKETEYLTYPVQLFPAVPQWQHYLELFNPRYGFLKHAAISAALGVGVATLTTITSSFVGFGFARFPEVKERGKLFAIVTAMIIIPGTVTVIPQFVIFAKLQLVGTYWPWVLWGLAGSPFLIFLFRQFFLTFPKELEDAAEIDGCSPFDIYWRIFLPNAMPALATSWIITFSGIWGDWFTPMLYLRSDNTTLAVAIGTAFRNPQNQILTTLTLAGIVVYILPMVIAFFLGQKYILKGVVTSGLAGR